VPILLKLALLKSDYSDTLSPETAGH